MPVLLAWAHLVLYPFVRRLSGGLEKYAQSKRQFPRCVTCGNLDFTSTSLSYSTVTGSLSEHCRRCFFDLCQSQGGRREPTGMDRHVRKVTSQNHNHHDHSDHTPKHTTTHQNTPRHNTPRQRLKNTTTTTTTTTTTRRFHPSVAVL